MNKQVILFGLKETSLLAKYYLEHDSDLVPIAFTTHRDYLNTEFCEGLPVVAFEDIEKEYPPSDFLLFAPLYAQQMNKVRAAVYDEGKSKGYNFASYISTKSTVWNAKVGENTFIGEDCTIQPFSAIGNNVIVWAGNHVGHHSVIHDHVYIAGQVAISGHCSVHSYSFLGGNCTIRDKIALAEGSLITMDSSVILPTKPWSVYRGVPARKIAGLNSLSVKL